MEPKNNEKKPETNWSSLPMLILWMIMEKLDIFDAARFAAVCRQWRSASSSNPRPLSTVGDGMPWLWRVIDLSLSNTRRELISFPGLRRFVMDRPDFAEASLLSSKEGWVLLDHKDSLLVLVHIFTGRRIQLPHRPRAVNHSGSFTTRDGVPHRVFIFTKSHTTVNIRTALAGDGAWTSCTFSQPERRTIGHSTLISIGTTLYIQDMTKRVIVFDVADLSFKELEPPGSRCGFMAEHNGELIYIDRGREDGELIMFDYSSFEAYRLNENVPDSWERLDETRLLGTRMFLQFGQGCVSAKGEGLMIYDIFQKRQWRCHDDDSPTVFVVVYDLLAGTAEAHPLPVGSFHYFKWVCIG